MPKKESSYISALDCKEMPDGNRVCRFHSPRRPLETRSLKIRTESGSIQGVRGFYCPDCGSFYMERRDVDETLPRLSARGISVRVQPLEATLREWREAGPPVDFDPDTPVYYLDVWKEEGMSCPLHPETALIPDDFRIRYKNREHTFRACFCSSCGKVIMRESLARQLEEDCEEIGLPAPDFLRLRKTSESTRRAVRRTRVKADEQILDGRKTPCRLQDEWDLLGEEDTIVISDSTACIEPDHESTEEAWRVIRVVEKQTAQGRGSRKTCLVCLGYCAECGRYYGEVQDFKALLYSGRPEVSLWDNTDSDFPITSGGVYQQERRHLQSLENGLKNAIQKIQNTSGYVGQYEVNRYGYDDGNLAYAKHRSQNDYKTLQRLSGYQSRPYEYRVDLTRLTDGASEAFYLGASPISLDGKSRVLSFNTKAGREMVNYRTTKLTLDGKEYQLKLRRRFDIQREQLFGYWDEWDDSAAFGMEIRDSFLLNVLKIRRRQHQLLNIISTIQERQNAILDLPLRQNLIVQGCAGSGKTMVMLHRLSVLQTTQAAFDPDKSLILTPNQAFNLHIDGLAESLQIQSIRRYSVENYYAAILEQYDPSFAVRGKIADEMAEDQTQIDVLYSDRFLDVLSAEIKTVTAELAECWNQIRRLPGAVRGAEETSAMADAPALLSAVHDALAASEREIRAKENVFQTREQESRQLKARISDLEKQLLRAEKDAEQAVLTEGAKAAEELRNLLQRQNRQSQELEAAITAVEEERQRIEQSLFIFNKSARLRKLESETDAKRGLLFDCRRMIDALSAAPDLLSLSPEELLTRLSELPQTFPDFPELRRHIPAIERQKETAEKYRENLESLRGQYERTRQEAEKAEAEQYGAEIRETLAEWKKRFDKATPETLYEQAYHAAAKQEGIRIKSKTRRCDLFLRLRFALALFGRPKQTYTLICIDEGQDLALNEYRLIRALNGPDTILNIYGDTAQLLKSGRGIDDWKRLAPTVPHIRTHILNENYRNTNQITEYCNDTLHMNMERTGVDGGPVKEIHRNELEAALSNLKLNQERIAVIVPRAVSKGTYLDHTRLSEGIRGAVGVEIGQGKIALVYADEVKGVEFDRVFAIPNRMSQNEKYIAFTRALSHLTLVFDYALDAVDNTENI